MTYIAKVIWYNDFNVSEETVNLFITGDSYKDIADKLSAHFGEEDIISMEIEPFAPDDFLVFDEDITDIFDAIRARVGERVIW